MVSLIEALSFSAFFLTAFGLFFKFIQIQGRKKHENSNEKQ